MIIWGSIVASSGSCYELESLDVFFKSESVVQEQSQKRTKNVGLEILLINTNAMDSLLFPGVMED